MTKKEHEHTMNRIRNIIKRRHMIKYKLKGCKNNFDYYILSNKPWKRFILFGPMMVKVVDHDSMPWVGIGHGRRFIKKVKLSHLDPVGRNGKLSII